jgi:hypothetical protein
MKIKGLQRCKPFFIDSTGRYIFINFKDLAVALLSLVVLFSAKLL